MYSKKLVFFHFLFFITGFSFSQTRTVAGKIIDANTQEPLGFSSIFLLKTTNGTTADANGKYSVAFTSATDSIEISAIGYKKQRFALSNESSQIINAELERANYSIKKVTIHFGQDPAVTMFKRIQRHKNKNDKNKLNAYQYQVYSKMEVDVDKISDKLKKSRLLKPFSFVFKNIDSVSEDKPFLPVYLTETLSDYYYRKNPKSHREIIKATQMAGGTQESLTEFLGTMYQDENLYDNRIQLMGVFFISPIANGGLFYYHYKITDTAVIDGRRCFQLTFQPKRTGENTFYGDLWLADSSWAIKQISMTTAKDANINFVSRISVFQSFNPINDSVWMMTKDKFIVNFVTSSKNKTGLIGRKTTIFQNILVNNPLIDTAFTDARESIVLDGATEKKSDFWDDSRPENLSKNEKIIYKMADTIITVPAFRHIKQLFTTVSTGYYSNGNFTYGPYYNMFAVNKIEGARVGFGIGNSRNVAKNLWTNAQFAYGFKDEKWKCDLSAWYVLNKKPRQELKIRYVNDVVTYNLLEEQLGENNLFSSMVRRVPYSSKLTRLYETKISYNNEWNSGFAARITLSHSNVHAFFNNDYYSETTNVADTNPTFINTEIAVRFRYAYQEKVVTGNFLRYSAGSKYPIVSVELKQGIKGVFNSSFSYQKIRLLVDGKRKTGTIGSFYYAVSYEKTFGNLPLVFLNVLQGNDTYYYNKFAFNGMTRYEFVTDQNISARLYEYFGGFPLNYIPLIKKLKWRTLVGAKAVWGSLSDANRKINGYNTTNFFEIPNTKPYIELGTGIENIFKVLRVDFIWRLNYFDKIKSPYAQPFGIRASVQVEF